MLILTPTPLETAAERAFFAELASWDTGGSVRAAVVASLPVVEGPRNRRQADAVLFVPEGLAVIRVVEVVRQSGIVTAAADGSWSIGPGAGPGEVLRLAGGGSNPLEGLMRAGMDAAVALRQAGLEPGRIARLTVLTGAVTGLLPADGDLGDGDHVALLDPRSLLLGIARASRYAGTDNPRLWTTADVRAGIEALGVVGRSPAVEELNGEGFPYSPYVLRRRELIEPMNLPSARGAALPAASGPTAGHVPFTPGPGRVPGAGPLVDPAAAARVAAAAVQAQEAAQVRTAQQGVQSAVAPSVPSPEPASAAAPGEWEAGRCPRDTIALPTESAPTESAPTESAPAETDRQHGVLDHDPVVGSGAAPDDTGGLGGLFAASAPVTRQLDQPAPPRSAPRQPVEPPSSSAARSGGASSWDRSGAPYEGWAAAPPPGAAGGSRRRTAVLVAAALVLIVVLGVGGWLLVPGGSAGGGDTRPSASSSAASSAAPRGPTTGATVEVNGVAYTMQVGVVDDSCAGHAYGAVAGFFAGRDCVGLSRALWSAQVAGQPAVVSVSRVQMADDAAAQALQKLTDGDGTGNVSDLLREGVSYAGAPARLSNAQYASSRTGASVTIVEASWAGAGRGTATSLDAAASNALTLPMADVPGAVGN